MLEDPEDRGKNKMKKPTTMGQGVAPPPTPTLPTSYLHQGAVEQALLIGGNVLQDGLGIESQGQLSLPVVIKAPPPHPGSVNTQSPP